jgi:hypothetical protein
VGAEGPPVEPGAPERSDHTPDGAAEATAVETQPERAPGGQGGGGYGLTLRNRWPMIRMPLTISSGSSDFSRKPSGP